MESSQLLSHLYTYCAQSLRFPESHWFTREHVQLVLPLLSELGLFSEAEQLAEVTDTSSWSLESAQIEYTRLFITGVPCTVAPPYGSVYIDRILQGQHTEKILHFYHANGYEMAEGSYLADHIVHQLEFLSLLENAGKADVAEDFIQSCFLPWFPAFSARVISQTKHPFYKIVVQLISYLILEDEEHVISNH